MLSTLSRFSLPVRGFVARCLTSWLGSVPEAPPDPILGMDLAFKADTDINKVNLGVGVYMDDKGNPYTLRCIKSALQSFTDDVKEGIIDLKYCPTAGVPGFTDAVLPVAYGEQCAALKEERIAAAQVLSGTGGLRVAGEFIKTFAYLEDGSTPSVYLPNITWANHKRIFKHSNLNVETYNLYDKPSGSSTLAVDVNAMTSCMKEAPAGSVFLVHACAHNPTGRDPTQEEWKEITNGLKENGHMVLIDSAYQGFASGDLDNDAFSIRHMMEQELPLMLVQSFAKNFGLYAMRIGALSIVTKSPAEKKAVMTQINQIGRGMYSNPPSIGAHVMLKVLSDPTLTEEWHTELLEMSGRLKLMREGLRARLEKDNVGNRSWDHITDQIGMFCYTGLTTPEIQQLREKHIYATDDGRFSIAGLNTTNLDYVATAMKEVLQ